jgi:hypothetical protein
MWTMTLSCFWLESCTTAIYDSKATEKVLQFLVGKAAARRTTGFAPFSRERSAGRVFDFEEGPSDFVPTYKCQPGADVYEQRRDKEIASDRRDRILRLAKENPSHVKQLLYTRNATQNVSDHNAV